MNENNIMQMNAEKIMQLRNSVAILNFVAQTAPALATDQTPMPDGTGTVASEYAKAVAALELPWLALLKPVQTAISAPTTEPAPKIAESIAPAPHNPPARHKMAGSW